MERKLTDKMYARLPADIEEHDEFLNRISKTLYYSKLPATDCLSLPVTELAAEIFTDVKHGPTLERLDVEEAGRISRNACVSPCSLVMALIYIERLKDCNPEYLQKVAPSELFLVSLLVASKFLHDEGEEDEVYNTEWAKSGDLSINKLNKLERDFLRAIKWTVFVDHEDFWKKLQRLEEDLAIREARKRGWFSYTELNTLLTLDSANLSALAQTVLGLSSVCIATYAVGLVTLLGSVKFTSSIPRTLMSLSHPLSAGLSDVDYSPLASQDSQQIEEQIADILLESVVEKTEAYNQTEENILICNCNRTVKENGWNWVIGTITPLLSYLNEESDCEKNWKNVFNQNSGYGTKTNFIIESDPFRWFSKFDKKKDTLDSDLNYGYLPKFLKSLTVM